MTENGVNPLNDLIAAEPPQPSRPHTTGRRELRLEAGARGMTIHHRDRSEREVLRAVAEGRAPQPTGTTLPIRRAGQTGKDRRERGQGGVSARQQKKARKAARQQDSQNGEQQG